MSIVIKSKNVWDYVGYSPAILFMVNNPEIRYSDTTFMASLRSHCINSYNLIRNAYKKNPDMSFCYLPEKNRVIAIGDKILPNGDPFIVREAYKHLKDCNGKTHICFGVVQIDKQMKVNVDSEKKAIDMFIAHCKKYSIKECIILVQTPKMFNLDYYRNLKINGMLLHFFEPCKYTLKDILT